MLEDERSGRISVKEELMRAAGDKSTTTPTLRRRSTVIWVGKDGLATAGDRCCDEKEKDMGSPHTTVLTVNASERTVRPSKLGESGSIQREKSTSSVASPPPLVATPNTQTRRDPLQQGITSLTHRNTPNFIEQSNLNLGIPIQRTSSQIPQKRSSRTKAPAPSPEKVAARAAKEALQSARWAETHRHRMAYRAFLDRKDTINTLLSTTTDELKRGELSWQLAELYGTHASIIGLQATEDTVKNMIETLANYPNLPNDPNRWFRIAEIYFELERMRNSDIDAATQMNGKNANPSWSEYTTRAVEAISMCVKHAGEQSEFSGHIYTHAARALQGEYILTQSDLHCMRSHGWRVRRNCDYCRTVSPDPRFLATFSAMRMSQSRGEWGKVRFASTVLRSHHHRDPLW